MEEPDAQSPVGPVGNTEMEANVMESFMKSFEVVQTIFDQNTALICEITRNHEENAPHGGLTRNIDLIRELNNNMGQVVQLYANMSAEFMKSVKEEDNINSVGGDNAAAAAVPHDEPSVGEADDKGSNKE